MHLLHTIGSAHGNWANNVSRLNFFFGKDDINKHAEVDQRENVTKLFTTLTFYMMRILRQRFQVFINFNTQRLFVNTLLFSPPLILLPPGP